MTYRKEIQDLIQELRDKSNAAKHEKLREKRRRQAEVLDFLINHPDDIKGVLDA